MLTAKFCCSAVCLNRYAMIRFGSLPGLISRAMRRPSFSLVSLVRLAS